MHQTPGVITYHITPMQYPNGVTKAAKVTTQPTESSKPSTNTSTQNGLNVLEFTNDYLVTNLNINRSDTPKLSVFAVFATKSTTGEGTLFGSDNGNWDRIGLLNFDANSAAKWGVSNGSTGTIPYNSSRTLDTNYHILSIGLNLHIKWKLCWLRWSISNYLY